MFAVVGANGKTGGAVVRRLIEQGRPVRALVRRETQAAALRQLGAEAVIGDVTDEDALMRLFADAEAAYAMNPPAYQDADLYVQAQAVHAALIQAAENAGVARLVALSSVGAQHAAETGNILTTHDFERQLAASQLTYTVLRAANFIDNWAWVLQPAREQGVLPSMMLPLDRAIPSVFSQDIGDAAARLMTEDHTRGHVVELHGPADYSPNDAAIAIGSLLGRDVEAVAVPEEQFVGVFLEQGMPKRSAEAFAEMYQGFNTGLIAFEGRHDTWRGATDLTDALASFVHPARDAE